MLLAVRTSVLYVILALQGNPLKVLDSGSFLQVSLIQFSPNERYLVTFSSVEPTNPRESTTLILNIFDLKSGAKLRNFQLSPEEVFIHPGGLATNWPIFKWGGGCNDK